MTTEADRFKDLYDVEKHVRATDGGILVEDPYPGFAELRAQAPVHRGSVRDLLGYGPGGLNLRPRRAGVSAFSYEANDTVLRETSSLLVDLLRRSRHADVRTQHPRDGRRRAPALPGAGAAGVLAEAAQWWIDNWIGSLVDEAVAAFEHRGYAELNAELCARIPLQTITSSFGLTQEEALDFHEQAGDGMASDGRAALARHERTTAMLRRVIEKRRAEPQDDVITLLVQSSSRRTASGTC